MTINWKAAAQATWIMLLGFSIPAAIFIFGKYCFDCLVDVWFGLCALFVVRVIVLLWHVIYSTYSEDAERKKIRDASPEAPL